MVDVDSPAVATISSGDSLINSWKGSYKVYLPGGEIGGVNVGWRFNIDVAQNECFFAGDGYQMAFNYKCKLDLSRDTLWLTHINISDELGISDTNSAMIIRINDSCYFNSSEIPEEVKQASGKYGFPIQKK